MPGIHDKSAFSIVREHQQMPFRTLNAMREVGRSTKRLPRRASAARARPQATASWRALPPRGWSSPPWIG